MAQSPQTRERLITSAQQLINARSYYSVGVQDICRLAGVKKGSFYHFFASKRDLALAALDETIELFNHTIFTRVFASDNPPLVRIEQFFNAVHEFHQRVHDTTGYVQGCPFGNLGSELSTQDEALRKKVDSFFRLAEAQIEQALEQAIACGDIPATDTAAAASAIFAYTEGLILTAKTRNDPDIIRNLGKRALQLAANSG